MATTRRAVAAATGILAGALVLAGCTADPRAAAVLEDRTISQATLERAQEDLGSLGTVPEAGRVLVFLIVAPTFIDAAAEHGVGVSRDDALEAMEASAVDAGLDPVPDFGDGSVEIIRMSLALQKLQGLPDAQQIVEELDAEVQALDVEVNPRYGEADLATATIARPDLPWIVATEAEDEAAGASTGTTD
ncbi:hypothetical protein [Actinotalea subterranea]|uniref:hypothetical protein n=1 Tax=Actinotalea subterranea TaxID=2607497 RepID=UPI0011ECB4FC|nr:hypothetical protein [Actinotalea subterranea]